MGYFYMKKYVNAISVLKKAVKKDPKNVVAHYYLGFIFDVKEEFEDAFNEYTLGLEGDPENQFVYLARGSLSFNRGNFKSAISDFAHYVDLQPTKPFTFQASREISVGSKKKIGLYIELNNYYRRPREIEKGEDFIGIGTQDVYRVPQLFRLQPTSGSKYLRVKKGVDLLLKEMSLDDQEATLEQAKKKYARITNDSYSNVNRLYHYHGKKIEPLTAHKS